MFTTFAEASESKRSSIHMLVLNKLERSDNFDKPRAFKFRQVEFKIKSNEEFDELFSQCKQIIKLVVSCFEEIEH